MHRADIVFHSFHDVIFSPSLWLIGENRKSKTASKVTEFERISHAVREIQRVFRTVFKNDMCFQILQITMVA